MLLSELLTPERVKVPLAGRTKDAVLRELVELAVPDRPAGVRAEILDAVRDRERLLSTGIGEGVAIPHARSSVIERLTLAVGVAPEPVDFESLDGRPADLFLLLLGPEQAGAAHLKALSRISRLVRREALRDSLRAAPDGPALLEAIRAAEAS